MNLAKSAALKQLHIDVCALCDDIQNMEVTAGNKEQLRDTILQRINDLPLVAPYKISDLQPEADATVRAEIEQMSQGLARLQEQLEAELGLN